MTITDDKDGEIKEKKKRWRGDTRMLTLVFIRAGLDGQSSLPINRRFRR
jgi:hypothetical protein